MALPEIPDWYLHEWFAATGRKQRDLITGLDWLPAKANKIWHGIQPAKVHEVAEIAAFLNVHPHELLMHPDDAFRVRRMEALLAELPRAQPVATPPVGSAPSAARKAG